MLSSTAYVALGFFAGLLARWWLERQPIRGKMAAHESPKRPDELKLPTILRPLVKTVALAWLVKQGIYAYIDIHRQMHMDVYSI